MTATTEPNEAIGAVHRRPILIRCSGCGCRIHLGDWPVHQAACATIAQDPAATGDRGVNLGLAENAATTHIHFPLKPSGLPLEKLAAENIGSSKC